MSPGLKPTFKGTVMANVRSSGFASRFSEARKSARLSVADVAKRMEISIQSVYGWEKGSVPKAERMNELAEMFDVPIQWLAFGEGEPRTIRDENGDWSVPALRVTASAGGGTLIERPSVVSMMTVNPVFIRQIYPGANRESLRIVTVHGQSMEPTYHNDDILLIDTSITYLIQEGYYVLSYSGLTYVKKLQPEPGDKLAIISDNPEYKSFTVDLKDESTQIQIHGLVIYSWAGTKR